MRFGNLLNIQLRKVLASFVLGILGVANSWSACTDSLIESAKFPNGAVIPYMLTSSTEKPSYALIMMPGGAGLLNPEMQEGKITFKFQGNFLIRSRHLFCDNKFIVASTNASTNVDRMEGIISDLKIRYPEIKICIIGTSRSTLSTMALSEPLDGKVSCFIHTASMSAISWLDTTKFRSRHLLVHHKDDGCQLTGYRGAEVNHKDYKTPLITMEGGITEGNPCEALGHHGFNGIEKETVDKIKAWIAQ